MARKKQEIQLQIEVDNQEEWEEMLAKEGLTVVDIYQEWCGPCKAMTSIFRKINNELGDELLHFAVAKADSVDSLEKYRGRCQPCFLFYAGGVLVSVVRGANSPLIIKVINNELSTEHKVLTGDIERTEIRDTVVLQMEDKDRDDDDEDDEETEEILAAMSSHHQDPQWLASTSKLGESKVPREVTVAIIKPDLVQAGKVEEIIGMMKEKGIEILEQQEKTFTEDEAKEFYDHVKDEAFFNDLITFMTSGPSVALVLTKGQTGDSVIQEWRDLLGPASVEEAKQTAPDSLRAKYGTEKYVNALHGSDSNERAMRELAFFFPEYEVPTYKRNSSPKRAKSRGKKSADKTEVQRTLALIRPDALREKKDEILEKIAEAGFKVAMQKEITLTKEQAEEFYIEHKDESYFEELTTRMSSGPLLALALARDDAIENWRDLLGPPELEKAQEEAPDSLRAQFALPDVPINQLHGSKTAEEAQKEIEQFFGPVEQTVAVIKPDAYTDKDDIMDKIKEAGFHIAARKETQLTPEIAEKFYQDHKDKEYFGDLVNHMSSGKTLFMVLSRENAVEGWRSLLGPTDPIEAKEANPDSLRAQFGKDIKANAVHGSSDVHQAKSTQALVFGELEFSPTGKLIGTVEASDAGQDDQDAAEVKEATETSAAEKAADGESKAAEGQDGPDDGEKPAEGDTADGQQTAEGAEETKAEPAEGEKATAEGETPADGEQAEAKDSEETTIPADGDEAPSAESDQPPADGEQAPAEGKEESPAGDDTQAAQAEGTPAEDSPAAETPAAETPAAETADDENQTPKDEEKPADEQKEGATETQETQETQETAEAPASEEPAPTDQQTEGQENSEAGETKKDSTEDEQKPDDKKDE